MAQVCELTGKHPNYGNNRSHSNIKTRTRWMPNLRSKKYEVTELKRSISLLLSTRAIRTIDKFGNITIAIMNAKENLLSPRLQKVRREIYRSRVNAAAAGKTAAATKAPAAKKAKVAKKVSAK